MMKGANFCIPLLVTCLLSVLLEAARPPADVDEDYTTSLDHPGKAVGWDFIPKSSGRDKRAADSPTESVEDILNGKNGEDVPLVIPGQTYDANPISEPVASFFSEDSEVFEEAGIQADPDVDDTNCECVKRDDRSVRLIGAPKSCLKVQQLSEAIRKCLKTPGNCTQNAWAAKDVDEHITNPVKGLSFSVWVNIPKSFNHQKEYILDTGGNEYGRPGIAMYTIGSLDGRSFTQQIVVIVSTGKQYWKVKLNGMTQPHAWNNVGFRWSPDSGPVKGGSPPPIGLQVFVNKTSVGWRRSPLDATLETVTPADPSSASTQVPPDMTFGCDLGGQQSIRARLDQPSFWLWYLRHDKSFTPTNKIQYSQIEKFDGRLTFKTPILRLQDDDPRIQASNFTPWQWDLEREYFADQLDLDSEWLDDTSPSVGDCSSFDAPSSWGRSPYYSSQKSKHPIDCARTVSQLQDAIAFANAKYAPQALVRAMVRVVNKNIMQDPEHIRILFREIFPKLLKALKEDTSYAMRGKGDGKDYANLIYILSRLQEPEIYESIWKGQNSPSNSTSSDGYRNSSTGGNSTAVKQSLGISEIMLEIETFFIELSKHLQTRLEVFVETNNTMIMIGRMPKSAFISGAPKFPLPRETLLGDLTNKVYYRWRRTNTDLTLQLIPADRADQWEDINDIIILPVSVTNEYGSGDTSISVIRMINKHLNLMLPGRIDSRVAGVEGHKFFVNSRVVSMALYPPPPDSSILLKYPIEYVLEHIKRQPELPYKKGPVLCAHWVYHENDTKMGSWDTGLCKIISTNDTHTHCSCAHMSDYAVLFEDYKPSGMIGDGAYTFCYALYAISIVCLIIYLAVILMNDRLHYELHIIGMNFGFALLFALAFYLSTFLAREKRIACLMVSVFIHYNYTAAYMWCLCMAHYIFRAITKGKLGGILPKYCFLSWGLPAVIVVILAGIDVTRYGIGERCLGAQNGYFLLIYIGAFIVFAALSCPLFAIALCNLSKNPIKDEEDRADVRMALYGVAIIWPFIMILWIMAILVYLEPIDSPMPDFMFELFNALQGLLLFVFIGILVPSFRNVFLCRKTERLPPPSESELQMAEDTLYMPSDGRVSSIGKPPVSPGPEQFAPPMGMEDTPNEEPKKGFFSKMFDKLKGKKAPNVETPDDIKLE